MTEHWEAMTYGVTSSLYGRVMNSFGYDFVALLLRTFYPSVEAKCTLGVAVCRFSGVLLNLAFKRFRCGFLFTQYQINLRSRVNS